MGPWFAAFIVAFGVAAILAAAVGVLVVCSLRYRRGSAACESQFRQVVESIPEVFWIGSPDWKRLDYVSSAYERVWGRSCRSLYDDPASWIDCVVPEDRPRVEAELRRRMAGEAAAPTWTPYRIRHDDASIRWIRTRSFPICNRRGQVRRIIGIAEDVTGRIESEQDRRSLEVQVQHAQKLESLGVLAGGIAHDFNNLLVSMLGNADLALMELPTVSSARGYVEDIKIAAARAADLTNQMLAYSGKGRFLVEVFDINELVREMTNLLEVSISKKAVLKYQLCDTPCHVEADVSQVRQVLMNLVTNASDAIDQTSGIITIGTGVMEADAAYLAETYLDDDLPGGTYVYMEISDTGCGMNEQTKGRLFDPFFTTKFTGRGLGLAAVLGIIRGHRGAIKVNTELGKGSTFRVLFPCSSKVAHVLTAGGEDPHHDYRGSGTILIIDDEETVRSVGKLMLQRKGFRVLTAADGREGVEVFRRHQDKIVAVLLDVTMPRMSGEEAYRNMQRIRGDVKVILCSGYTRQDATSRFAGKGLAGFIQKPFGAEQLVGAVRQTLERPVVGD